MARKDRFEIIEKTERGEKEMNKNNEGLLKAAESGDLEGVIKALKDGANVNTSRRFDSIDRTALMLASREGQTEIVEFLIKAGADKEAKDNEGRTALMLAARYGQTEIVELLIKAGADKEAKDDEDKTALMFAAWYGHAEIVELLIKAGADKDGWTALMMFAAFEGKQKSGRK